MSNHPLSFSVLTHILSSWLVCYVMSICSGLLAGGRRGHGRGTLCRLHLTLSSHHRIAGLVASRSRGARHQRAAAQTGIAGRMEGGAAGLSIGGRAHLCLLQVCFCLFVCFCLIVVSFDVLSIFLFIAVD